MSNRDTNTPTLTHLLNIGDQNSWTFQSVRLSQQNKMLEHQTIQHITNGRARSFSVFMILSQM